MDNQYALNILSSSDPGELKFRAWYEQQRKMKELIGQRLSNNPDDWQHMYDWRKAFQSGASMDINGHFPSEFKSPLHPRAILDNIDTKTGKPPNYFDLTGRF